MKISFDKDTGFEIDKNGMSLYPVDGKIVNGNWVRGISLSDNTILSSINADYIKCQIYDNIINIMAKINGHELQRNIDSNIIVETHKIVPQTLKKGK